MSERENSIEVVGLGWALRCSRFRLIARHKAQEQEIYGVVQDNLRMIDVGKLNSLDDAEALLDELKD